MSAPDERLPFEAETPPGPERAAAPERQSAVLAALAARAGETARRLRPAFAALRAEAFDLVFPPCCIACRAAVASRSALCPSCWTKTRFIERPYCERLGAPFAVDLGEGLLSPEAVAHPPVFARARAAVEFDDGPARLLVHRLKYYDRLEIARPMGAWMARAGAELLADADVLVPVPLHRWRLFGRRYNQAMALAEAVSAESGIPVDPFGLARVKATKTQVRLTRTQRALNLQGAFRVEEAQAARIEGRNVVLIDDVLTSGATANAAARALLRAGAARVDVLTFARVG
ncbi:ComF family protein [Methylocella sp.]|uniref:ComF family protein n=1 Tax=Methylocella sp. TaxID=1978226 RepID=UPI003784296F